MGGSSFHRPATRMSSSTLDLLTTYCTSSLAPLFPRIERMHHVRSKTDHGDLDLVCGAPFGIPITRADVGMVGTPAAKDAEAAVERPKGKKENADCRASAETLATKLGAEGWMVAYYGYPLVALRVPCRAIDPEFTTDAEAFYQVHLGLIPLPSFPAYRVLTSYSIPYAILVLALQTLSSALWLRRDKLTLRHSPLANQPLLELTLCSDFESITRWLGLNIERWEKGFDTYTAVYEWITNNPTKSTLHRAWPLVRAHGLKGMRVDWKRFHTREDGLQAFVDWLRVTATPDVAVAAEYPPLRPTPVPSADPKKPTPLDAFAQEALAYFDEEEAYAALLGPRQEEAKTIAVRQKKKAENRAAEAARMAAKLKRDKAAGAAGTKDDTGRVTL